MAMVVVLVNNCQSNETISQLETVLRFIKHFRIGSLYLTKSYSLMILSLLLLLFGTFSWEMLTSSLLPILITTIYFLLAVWGGIKDDKSFAFTLYHCKKIYKTNLIIKMHLGQNGHLKYFHEIWIIFYLHSVQQTFIECLVYIKHFARMPK